MKHLLSTLTFIFIVLLHSHAQSPTYYFSVYTDTAYESNASVIVGYIKTDTPPSVPDTVAVVLKAGSPRPTHMDTASSYLITFAPGQDSAPFIIQIMKDTFPEYPEHVLYVLTNPVNGSSIGTDSSFLFVLVDTTPPATIGYIVDSASCYDNADSFINGVYIPYGGLFYVGITVNNPNPFYVRYIASFIDSCEYHGPYPINVCEAFSFYYNTETYYAPPGMSTYYKQGYAVNENSTTDKYFYCTLENIDANVIADSLVFFTIKHTNYFDTPSLSFDVNSIMEINDSFRSIGIPVTISNPNRKPLYFHIDTIQSRSSFPGINYTFNNQEYGYGHGISHDTFWVSFTNTHLISDTISMTFALRNDSANSSSDTLITITVIDTGTLQISFYGAGFSYLKSDSIGYVKVYTTAPATYPISVDVSYLNGNAIRDTDFIFTDTTITFPPYVYDTISLPVIMLQDHIHSGNTQVNLGLSNVNPPTVQYGITQYSFIIIDDEDSVLSGLGVRQINSGQSIDIYPNPAENILNIETILSKYDISISNTIGEKVYESADQSGNMHLDLSSLSSGLYLIKISNKDISYTCKIMKL